MSQIRLQEKYHDLITWDQWWEEIKKLYGKPVETYDGLVYYAGIPPKDAKKEMYSPSPEAIEKWASDERSKSNYRELFDQGKTPQEAWDSMF